MLTFIYGPTCVNYVLVLCQCSGTFCSCMCLYVCINAAVTCACVLALSESLLLLNNKIGVVINSTHVTPVYSHITEPESVRQRRKTGVFVETASETPYCMMRHIFSRSWHSCKLICKRLSSIHNSSYWWVNDILTHEDCPVELELGQLSVAAILNLPTTLQCVSKWGERHAFSFGFLKRKSKACQVSRHE